jgi:hypothetical protein
MAIPTNASLLFPTPNISTEPGKDMRVSTLSTSSDHGFERFQGCRGADVIRVYANARPLVDMLVRVEDGLVVDRSESSFGIDTLKSVLEKVGIARIGTREGGGIIENLPDIQRDTKLAEETIRPEDWFGCLIDN